MGALNQIPDSRRADAVEIGLLIRKHVSVIYNESRAFTSGIDEAVASIVLYLENGASRQSSQATTPPPVPPTREAAALWGFEDTGNQLWIGPMRPDGAKIARVVYRRNLTGYLPQYAEQARADAKLTVDAINSALAPTPGETPGQDAVAAALEAADWSGVSIGNKALIRAAINSLASLRSTQADTGGESQTPSPAGDAVEALKDFVSVFEGVDTPLSLAQECAYVRATEFLDKALAAIAQGPGAGQADAARDVLAERQRQVRKERWSLRHDDTHASGELARAAACYAERSALGSQCVAQGLYAATAIDAEVSLPVPADWPWVGKRWKFGDRRQALVKAGALILAEIERLDRASLPAAPATAASKGD